MGVPAFRRAGAPGPGRDRTWSCWTWACRTARVWTPLSGPTLIVPEVPFVVLTGLADEIVGFTAVRQGAQDYLIKGEVDGKLLLRAIRYATERKKAERALEAERKKLFPLLDSLPAFVHLKGADFIIQFANRRFREVFGEPEHRPCYEVLRGRSEPCEHCRVLEVLKTKVPQRFEWTPSLNARTYEVYHYPFCAEDELLVLTLGIDIYRAQAVRRAAN